MARDNRTFTCPNCEARVKRTALACPSCGSDRSTGWADDAGDMWYEDLPGHEGDDDFDYDAFVEREFGEPAPWRLDGRWVLFAAALVFAFAVAWIIRSA